MTQPILYLVLFGPLLKNVTGGGLGGNASWSVFVPGLLLQLCIFTGGFAGFGIIQELREQGVAAVFTPKDYDLTTVMDRIVDVVRAANGL
jgi:hypothetical protein